MKISATFEGSVENYAMAWLHLTNNAREFPEIFLKHYNNSGDSVFVVTPEKCVERMKDYLNGFNTSEFTVKIYDVETVPTITPLIDWEATYEDEADDYVEVLPWEDLTE